MTGLLLSNCRQNPLRSSVYSFLYSNTLFGLDVKTIFGRMDSLSVGEALSQLAFGKSCHQPA
ncbi:hypothetical protein, partial [Pradoshia eiseniae]|uniref:hypothetical protein n=1 Tax=Pradoshia eiseniae TaxID=2064768 RepID=UPI001F168FA2